jgi:hypothetical protein
MRGRCRVKTNAGRRGMSIARNSAPDGPARTGCLRTNRHRSTDSDGQGKTARVGRGGPAVRDAAAAKGAGLPRRQKKTRLKSQAERR